MENRKMVVVFLAGVVAAVLVVYLASKMFSGGGSREAELPVDQGPAPMADYSADITRLKEALQANPNDVPTLVQLGNLNYDSYQARGETSFCGESIRYYERALALSPGDPNVMTDLGYMYRCAGKVDEAIKRFRDAIKIAPAHPQSRMNLAITLYYDKGDIKGAKEAAEELIKLLPNDPHASNAKQLLAEIAAKQAADKPPAK